MSTNRKPGRYNSPLLIHAKQASLTLSTLLCLAVGLPSCSSNPTPIAQSTAPAVMTSPSAAASVAASPSPAAAIGETANKTQETRAIEASIISTLSPQIPSPITAANCPNLEKVEAGKIFDCDLTIAEGVFPATVTLKDTNGAFGVNTKNLLVIAAVEKKLPDLIKAENHVDVKVDCGSSKVKIFKSIGETFECKLAQPDGKAGTATVTTTTLAGGVDAKWKLEQ